MEKCSMCQQRLQAGKLEAKSRCSSKERFYQNGLRVAACSSDTITFGDLNDPESMVSKERADEGLISF